MASCPPCASPPDRMPRKNDPRRRNDPHRRHYDEPTEIVTIRMPKKLHSRVKAAARNGRMPKSRKVVQLIEKGLEKAPTTGGVFD